MTANRRATLVALVILLGAPAGVSAQECRPSLLYAFQPDCFRQSLTAACDKRKTGDRLDLGPQIAVWLESAVTNQYVQTLMVTNLVAVRGLGNRPGAWRLPSSPKFPYGKRRMALPIWSVSRGKLYDAVVMQDGPDRELWLGYHEAVSSPDPYYCRPMSFAEIDVDAISCPTARFNSAKGKFSSTEKSYYPPRNDLTNFTDRDCDGASAAMCPTSARRFADINDLDAVAAATPPYGQVFRGAWDLPNDLPEGDYALLLEVSKEFDNNQFHAYTAYQDPQLTDSGLRNNFGQPSVIYRVPVRLDHLGVHQAAATDITGYGDWDGETGTRHPPDQTITEAPGSGRGRLLAFSEPSLSGGPPLLGRVHVSTRPTRGCDPLAVGAGVIAGLEVPPETLLATEALIRFIEPADGGLVVQQYDIRYREGSSLNDETFKQATPASAVAPGAPGLQQSFRLAALRPLTTYVVGVRARGCCIGEGPLATISFTTAQMKFKQLSGCFIATAAFGSALDPSLAAMRRLRDDVRRQSAVGASLVDIYERSSPPVADLLRLSDTGRAVVRQVLAPIADLLDMPANVHF